MSDTIEDKSDVAATVSLRLAGLNAVVLIGAMGTALVIRHRFAGIFADFEGL
jgi:hypothetical protein